MAQQRSWLTAGVLTDGRAGRWGLALIETALAYEWLVSALNKLLDPRFAAGLAPQLRQSLHDNPNHWYSALLNDLVVPHARVYATLIEIGEFLIGLGFLVGAMLWLSRRLAASAWARPVTLAVMAAVAASGLLSANYYLNGGETLPGLNRGNPYNEGLSIDGLLTLVALGLLVAHGLTLRRPVQSAAAKQLRQEDGVSARDARRDLQRPGPDAWR
jgi:thiosulfate dehydrogenase [quinone] large subunit